MTTSNEKLSFEIISTTGETVPVEASFHRVLNNGASHLDVVLQNKSNQLTDSSEAIFTKYAEDLHDAVERKSHKFQIEVGDVDALQQTDDNRMHMTIYPDVVDSSRDTPESTLKTTEQFIRSSIQEQSVDSHSR